MATRHPNLIDTTFAKKQPEDNSLVIVNICGKIRQNSVQKQLNGNGPENNQEAKRKTEQKRASCHMDFLVCKGHQLAS